MQLGAPVLIIDDDPVMAKLVQDILETAGHDTAVARNAFHGLGLPASTGRCRRQKKSARGLSTLLPAN